MCYNVLQQYVFRNNLESKIFSSIFKHTIHISSAAEMKEAVNILGLLFQACHAFDV